MNFWISPVDLFGSWAARAMSAGLAHEASDKFGRRQVARPYRGHGFLRTDLHRLEHR
jgi:hypothetical protein